MAFIVLLYSASDVITTGNVSVSKLAYLLWLKAVVLLVRGVLAVAVIFPNLLVIFAVRQYVNDVSALFGITQLHDQSKFIAADVEHGAIAYGIGVRKVGACFSQIRPYGAQCDTNPATDSPLPDADPKTVARLFDR
jgi:hypothetical protein